MLHGSTDIVGLAMPASGWGSGAGQIGKIVGRSTGLNAADPWFVGTGQ
jgi:hypothetical protein